MGKRSRQKAASRPAPGRPAVTWVGTQFTPHSLSYVNREICRRLVESGAVDLTAVSSVPADPLVAGDPGYRRLANRVRTDRPRAAAVEVRHTWPPSFSPPESGAWVHIQPWEFGGLPGSWINPLRRDVDETWVYTTWLGECYAASGVPAEKIRLIPLGVDQSLFTPRGPVYPLASRSEFRFLFVGGTISRKGIEELVTAYCRAFTAADDVCLVIKGSGSASYYRGTSIGDELARLRRDNPAAPRIEYVDADLPHEDLAALYRSCDALVHPYRGEGFGMPILEAMASGLPVIVTGYGACLDFCDDSNAFLIPATLETIDMPDEPPAPVGYWWARPDVDALGEILRTVAGDPAAARVKAERGLARAREMTWDVTAGLVAERLCALADTEPVRQRRVRSAHADVEIEAPRRASIVLAVQDGVDQLTRCLEAVIEHTADSLYDVVIVDRGSHDATADFLARLDGDVHVVRAARESGVALARNAGLAAAAGRYVVFLDPAIEVGPGWLDPLVAALDADPDVAAVGAAATASVTGTRTTDGKLALYSTAAGPETAQAVSAVTGELLAVRRSTALDAGGYDDRLDEPSATVDLCWRLRARGGRIVSEPASAAKHRSPARTHLAPDARLERRWADRLDGRRRPHLSGPSTRPGVNVVGFFHGEFGVAEAARLLHDAVGLSGVPHVAIPLRGTAAREDFPFEGATSSTPLFDTTVWCVNGAWMGPTIPAALRAAAHSIGYWFWETDTLPDDHQAGFDHVDEVWAGSSFIQQAVQRVAPCPVYTVAPPTPTPSPPTVSREQLGLPADRFVFLFMFDHLSSMERKNPLGLVEAFRRAFAPGDGPILVIKAVNGERVPGNRAQLAAAAAAHPDIWLVEDYLPHDLNAALLAHADAYVSLHAAEGYGLTMAESMARGKPVIATAYSGNLDFMTPENSFLVPYDLVAAPPGGPFPPGTRWARPDIDAAAHLMATIVFDPATAAGRATRAAADFAALHTPAARARLVGELLRSSPARRRPARRSA